MPYTTMPRLYSTKIATVYDIPIASKVEELLGPHLSLFLLSLSIFY